MLRVNRKRVIRGNDQAPIHHSYRICKVLPKKFTYSGAFMEGTTNMGVMDAAVADLNLDHAGSELPTSTDVDAPPHMGIDIASKLTVDELETFMRVLVCSLRIPQEAVPPATYDGSEGTRRLTLTLRTKSRQ